MFGLKVIYLLIILIVSSNNSGELWESCLLSHTGAIEWCTVLFLEIEKSEMERHENSALFHFLEFITLANSRK